MCACPVCIATRLSVSPGLHDVHQVPGCPWFRWGVTLGGGLADAPSQATAAALPGQTRHLQTPIYEVRHHRRPYRR
jgi:hypothetical protein